MTFATEAGYTLPGGDLPLTHARILHAGNQFQARAITASAELSIFPARAAGNPLTYERWRPFDNLLSDPDALGGAAWTPDGVAVAPDGQTLVEDVTAGAHGVEQSFTYTAAEHVAGVHFKINGGRREIQVRVDDGTTIFSTVGDVRDLSTTDSNGVGELISLGDNEYLLKMYFTPAAAAGDIQINLYDDTGSGSYTGDGVSGVLVSEVTLNLSSATLRLDTYGDNDGTMIALGGHNFGSGGARVTFQHDSNDDGTFTDIGSLTPSDNQPIMYLFAPVTSSRWQIKVDRGVIPELAVMRVGDPLQMLRPIHQDVTPIETNRRTILRGNQSEGGEWLGRSRVRNSLDASFNFPRLTPGWVRSNLDGALGAIRSLEIEPFFIAWRPDTYAEAHYCWIDGRVDAPRFDQKPNLMSWSIKATAYGFE